MNSPSKVKVTMEGSAVVSWLLAPAVDEAVRTIHPNNTERKIVWD
jgi:hypothetical protein